MKFRLAAAMAILCFAPAGTHAGELAGLWKTKGCFGPDAHGALVIQKRGTDYRADMLGREVPVRLDAGELTFELPDRLGRFRGKLEGKNILGHWFRYATSVNGNGSTAPVVLSPVLLKPEGHDRWRGDVEPLQDEFTFFLLLTRQPDGTLSAVLRNPEFDFGTQQHVERLTVDGTQLKLIGKRGGKEREVGTGTWDVENDTLTLDFPGRGGNYDFHRDGDDSEFYPRGRHPDHYAYRAPPRFDDGWPTATLDAENIDVPAMERFIQKLTDMPMDSNDALQIHGVLIARHGKLVLEEYFHGEHRDKMHMTRSAAKSVTAVLVGAVIQAGAPLKLSSPVYQVMNGGEFPADLKPQKRTMTLEHLLTMSSGLFCDDSNDDAPGNEDKMWDQTEEPDFYRLTLKVPQATPPGENAVYCSVSPNLALGMVGRATREFPIYSFDRLIAGPMKIGNYAWPMDPAGNPYGGGGSQFLPRDFMKFGQLILNGGTWNGRRILSEEFVKAASTPQYHLANIYYGYNGWMEDFPYKDRNVRAVMALGAGGQIVTVVPELELVVAFYAGNYSGRAQIDLGHNYVPRFILPAVRQASHERRVPAGEGSYSSPYGRAKDGSRITDG
jgi:CubicO group peptidase (beta-lactamase class C family)